MKKTFLFLSAMLLAIGTQAAVKQSQWDLTVQSNQEAAVTAQGYALDGDTIYGVDSIWTAYTKNGFNIYPYNMDGNFNVDNHYVKFTMNADTKDSVVLTVREGSTGARTWKFWYKMMPKGTAITESLTNGAVFYDSIYNDNGKCDIITLKTIFFDMTGKKDQDIYFFQTCDGTTAGKNQMSIRIVDKKEFTQDKDTNTALTKIIFNDIEYPATATTLYGNIANETANLIGVAEALTSKIDTVIVTNPTTKGATTTADIVVTAESGKKQTYTFTIMGAEYKETTFKLNGLSSNEEYASFCAAFVAQTKDTVIDGVKYVLKTVKAGSEGNGVNFSGVGLYVPDVTSTKNGQNAIIMTIPANVKGYLKAIAQATSDGKNINFYAYGAEAGTAVSDIASQREAAVFLGNVAQTVKTTNYRNKSAFVDYSTVETAQDFYFFQDGSGVRYREITLMKFITEGSSTNLIEAAEMPAIKKMVVNGQLMIVKDGVRYNALGAVVE